VGPYFSLNAPKPMEIPGAYAAQMGASLKKAQQAIDVLHLESARKKNIFSTPLETKI
jgi:hypothetical protein